MNATTGGYRLILSAGLMLVCGCASFRDQQYELAQSFRTHRAWMGVDTGLLFSPYSADYASGWKSGYRSVLTGGDGRAPVLPPRKYWDPPLFLCPDLSARQDWFNGFRCGANAAASERSLHYVQPLFGQPMARRCGAGVCKSPVRLPMQFQASPTNSHFEETPFSSLSDDHEQPTCTIRLLGIRPRAPNTQLSADRMLPPPEPVDREFSAEAVGTKELFPMPLPGRDSGDRE